VDGCEQQSISIGMGIHYPPTLVRVNEETDQQQSRNPVLAGAAESTKTGVDLNSALRSDRLASRPPAGEHPFTAGTRNS